MTKIMLVEDDNNLREIYEARLLAEGYEIVSAKDGEEALATAVKEKPDLIISDVMMPKISGFDMLDILRSTPETKNTKVIMMTALSQAEDKARADKLGADKYLVKSQVTLEDVARVAREVISGEASPSIDSIAPGTPAATAPAPPTPVPAPAAPAAAAEPVVAPPAAPILTATPAPVPEPVVAPPDEPINVVAEPSTFTAPDIKSDVSVAPEHPTEESGSSKRIIQPLSDMNAPASNINDLAAKEDALEAAANPKPTTPPVNPDAPVADTVIQPADNNTSAAL